MITTRTLAGVALALSCLVSSAPGQIVGEIEQDTATLGDVVRVFGSDLGAKPKLVLVQDGAAAKKTKLKVVGSGDTTTEAGGPSGPYVDVVVTKAFPGEFQIGVKLKKDVVGVSPDSLELVPPTPESVDPGVAMPGDEVVLLVRDYADQGKHTARVGNATAKIVDVQAPDQQGLREVTIQVPAVANGVWPVSIQNRLGTGVLKNALEVTGSNGKPGSFAAQIDFVGLKPFKAKKKSIATDEQGGDPGEVNVGAVSGSKKAPKVFGIALAGQIADLGAGDLLTSGDDALILYSETQKGGGQCTWSSSANQGDEDIAIQIIAIDDDAIVLFVCGKLRRALGDCGPEVLCFSGMLTAPGQAGDDGGNGTACVGNTDATGTTTGAFVSDPSTDLALYGLTPGTLRFASGTADTGGHGFPDQVLTWSVSFNPSSDATPVTFDTLNLDGTGLTVFNLELADGVFWNVTYAPQIPPTPSSMSVTITSVDPVPSNPFGILGCIKGSFTGTLTESAPGQPVQSFAGTFEIPWYDLGFGQ